MFNYPFFLNLLSTFIYVPISFLYIIPMIKFGSAITVEQQAIPKRKFLVMGCLDGLAGIMQTFATNFILTKPLIILLQQAAIPCSMLISKWLLAAKYKGSQYVGAAVVMAGIIVVLMPEFLQTGSCHSAGASAHSSAGQLIWAAVMFLSCIPMCLSSVYKEKALGETEIDVIYLNGWVAVFQLIFTIVMAIPAAYAMGLTVQDVPGNFWGGMKCYAGLDSNVRKNGSTYITSLHGGAQRCHVHSATTASSGGGCAHHPADYPKYTCDDCGMAPLFVSMYLVFNIGYNLLIIAILKFGSANVLWLAMTVMVPLGNTAFYIPGVPNHVSNVHWEDFAGLIVIMLGLCTYRFAHKILKRCCGEDSRDSRGRERKASFIVDDEDEQVGAHTAARIFGANQIEVMQPLMDTAASRLVAARPDLTKSPEQLRHGYLQRLGLSPRTIVPPRAFGSNDSHFRFR